MFAENGIRPLVARSEQAAMKVQLVKEPGTWRDDARFFTDLAGPVIAAVFGYLILRVTKKLEQRQWRSQKLIEKRITEWDVVRPELNDIFCYCARVGSWKNMTPPDVIGRKRAVDKKVHLARPYFSKDFFSAYLRFIKTCFAQHQGHAVDAKLRCPVWEHQNAQQNQWNAAWDALFHQDVSSDDELWAAYEELLAAVSKELDAA